MRSWAWAPAQSGPRRSKARWPAPCHPYSNSDSAQCQGSPIMVFYVNHDGYNGQPDHNEVGAKEKVYFFHVKIYTGAIFTKNELCIQKCMYEVTTLVLETVLVMETCACNREYTV